MADHPQLAPENTCVWLQLNDDGNHWERGCTGRDTFQGNPTRYGRKYYCEDCGGRVVTEDEGTRDDDA